MHIPVCTQLHYYNFNCYLECMVIITSSVLSLLTGSGHRHKAVVPSFLYPQDNNLWRSTLSFVGHLVLHA